MLGLFGIKAKQNSPTLYISIGNLRLSDPGIEMEGPHKDGTLVGDKTRGYLPPPGKYFEAS